MTDTRDIVSVERTIDAPPEKIFELVADPRRHHEFDGSGTVRDVKAGGDDQLELGSEFGMSMKLGIPYSMVSTVVEFEDGRRVAWQSRPPGLFGKIAGGRIWRYELEPLDSGGTLVRESWDVSQDKQRPLLRIGPTPKKTRTNMEKTLERIDELVGGSS
ncbi:MAG TPA: SRPBCC family protein [Acidimicrobiia bacterium]|nr:SRPBCC family protein [Acidimicrobiia bacterium]